jgi:hypothetical protein
MFWEAITRDEIKMANPHGCSCCPLPGALRVRCQSPLIWPRPPPLPANRRGATSSCCCFSPLHRGGLPQALRRGQPPDVEESTSHHHQHRLSPQCSGRNKVVVVEEPLLREFLLDQFFFLQESLESSLVPRVIEELLGRELIATTPSIEHIPSPLPVGSKVAEGIQWLFAPLSPLSMGA